MDQELRSHNPLADALDSLGVPAYMIDSGGVLVWGNRAAQPFVGDREGGPFLEFVCERWRARARSRFESQLAGGAPATDTFCLVNARGRTMRVVTHTMPVREGSDVVGVFGVALRVAASPRGDLPSPLTERQGEVLRLLVDGFETEEIAARLGISTETARNHIRGLLRRLGVHSRLDAVVAAFRLGLVELDD